MKKIISALFLLQLFTSFASQAATRNVCASGATYTTIAAAIAAAANGDEIVICTGTYNESLSFSQSNLTIRSSTGNRGDVKISNSGTVFTISGQNATLKNMTITSTGGGNAAITNDYNNGIGTHTFENLAITAKGTGIYLQTGGPHTFRQLDIASSGGSGISIAYNADAAHVFDTVTVNSQDVGIAATRGAASMKNITVTSSNDIGISLSSKYSTLFQTVKVSAKKDGLVITTQDDSSPLTFSNIEISSENGAAINLQRGIASMTSVKATSGNDGMVLYGASLLKDVDTSAKNIALNIGSQSAANLNGVVAKSTSGNAILFKDTGGGEYIHNLKNITITGAGDDGLKVEKSAQINAENICVQSASGNAVRFDYNAKKVTLINSILNGHGGYGVSMMSNPESNSHVNNSCFYKAPCAEAAWPSSARDFSGNYTGPANCNNGAYTTFTSSLPNCPLVTSSCYVGIPTAVTVGGFNAFESSTAVGAITGVIKTKIAGAAIGLDVIALNTAKTAVETGFAGDVKVELLGNVDWNVALDAVNCPVSSTLLTSQVLTFATANAGRKNVAIAAVPNVYRDVRVRLSYPATGTATVVACSTDNFAIRPDKFINVSATDNDWQTVGTVRSLANSTATGGNVHKAGRPFTLSATAVNATAAQAATSNYTGGPTATVVCTLPTLSSCANGTLATTTWNGSGTTRSDTATYSEVGSFNLTLADSTFANVDINDSSVAEYTIYSDMVSVGRFVPDHFVLTVNTAPVFQTFNETCTDTRSFTYLGQPFGYYTRPVVAITAQNLSGGTTTNYRDTLWTLTDAGVDQTYSPDAPELNRVAAAGPLTFFKANGTGTITVNTADKLVFMRDVTTPRSPFNANISLTMRIAETVTGHGQVGGTGNIVSNDLVFNGNGTTGIAFDSGNLFRYGRMRMDNANGSELLNLSLPIRTDFWNGTNFVANTADNCTAVAPANVTFRGYSGGLNVSNMPVARVTSGSTLRQGVGRIVLTRPAPAPASNGSVDVCVDLGADTAPPAGIACTAVTSAAQPWLQGRWSQILFDDDPGARATFGVYKSGPVIYMREVY